LRLRTYRTISPVGVPTVSEWIGILETTGQSLSVPPYFENFGKRLVKSPKIYFTDAGLACYPLGLESAAAAGLLALAAGAKGRVVPMRFP